MHFNKRFVFYMITLTLFLVFVSCSKIDDTAKKGTVMEVKSAAFGHRTTMPGKYTCDGADVSPPLEWRNAPSGTKTFAIICDTTGDTVARNRVHCPVAGIGMPSWPQPIT